jgi:hypothetical protein
VTRRGVALAAAVVAIAVVGLAAAAVAVAARAAEVAVRARAVAVSDAGVARAALAWAVRAPLPALAAPGAAVSIAVAVGARGARAEWSRYGADLVRVSAAAGGAWVGVDGRAMVDSAGVAWFAPLGPGAVFAR